MTELRPRRIGRWGGTASGPGAAGRVVPRRPGSGGPARVTRRATLGGLSAAGVAGTLGACTRGAPGQPSSAAELDQAVTLDFLTRQPYEAAFEEAIARFRARFPKAQVQRDHQANNTAFNQKLETLAAAGTPPDVAFAVGSTYHGQAARGFFEDLTPYLGRDKTLDVNDFVPFWLEAGKFRGKLYFFPFDPGTTVVFWNKRHFAAAGLKAPDVTQAMTWPQFQELARQLTRVPPAVPESQAQFGCELMTDRLWYLLPWQMGVEVFDKDFRQCRLNDPQAIDAIQFAADLRGKHGVWRPATYEGPATSFVGGSVAMSHTGYWEAGPRRERMQPAGEDFDVMPLPTFPGRPRLTIGWGSGNAMVAGGSHKAMAWEFVKHLSDREVYEILLERGVMQPVRKSQANSPAYRKHTPPHSFDVPLDDTRTARTPPFHPAMGELPAMMVEGLAEAFAGKSAVKPLVEQLVPLVNAKLAEFNARYPAG
jgi:multiple sugar transport system substrate-binding protein